MADEEAREAQVIVPDYQLSLAIGKEGQNARLAARLTGYKIDIKSETQAREMGLFDEMGIDYQEEGVYDDVQTDFGIGSSGYPEEYDAGDYPADTYEAEGYPADVYLGEGYPEEYGGAEEAQTGGYESDDYMEQGNEE